MVFLVLLALLCAAYAAILPPPKELTPTASMPELSLEPSPLCLEPSAEPVFESSSLYLEPSAEPILEPSPYTSTTLQSLIPLVEAIEPNIADAPACLPRSARVMVQDAGLLPIASVRVGDYVLDADGKFTPVLLWTHYDDEASTEMVALNSLLVSPGHYVPTHRGFRAARLVHVGDSIAGERVRTVERVRTQGLYNPQTASGSLRVWFGKASSAVTTYTEAFAPAGAHAALLPLRVAHRLLTLTRSLLPTRTVQHTETRHWGAVLGSAAVYIHTHRR